MGNMTGSFMISRIKSLLLGDEVLIASIAQCPLSQRFLRKKKTGAEENSERSEHRTWLVFSSLGSVCKFGIPPTWQL
jgi:hypothetical protein